MKKSVKAHKQHKKRREKKKWTRLGKVLRLRGGKLKGLLIEGGRNNATNKNSKGVWPQRQKSMTNKDCSRKKVKSRERVPHSHKKRIQQEIRSPGRKKTKLSGKQSKRGAKKSTQKHKENIYAEGYEKRTPRPPSLKKGKISNSSVYRHYKITESQAKTSFIFLPKGKNAHRKRN